MSNFFISQESVDEMINDLQDEIFSSNINISEEKYNAIHESLVEEVNLEVERPPLHILVEIREIGIEFD